MGLAITTAVTISALSYASVGRLIQANRKVQQSYRVLDSFKQLDSGLQEAGALQTAYQAANSQTKVDRFRTRASEIANHVDQLGELTRGNKRHQSRLKAIAPVIKTRLHIKDAPIVSWLSGQIAAAQREEMSLLASNEKSASTYSVLARFMICSNAIVGLALLVAMLVVLHRSRTTERALLAALSRVKELMETANRSKIESLANSSHEIRTAINGVIGMLDVLLGTSLDKHQKEFAETAKSSADSLLAIITDALDGSKLETGKADFELVDFDLREAVEQSLELLAPAAAEKGLELGGFVEPDVPIQLRGDPRRLRQVLSALVSNGIKFTERGEVRVRAFKERETEIHVVLRFEVKDTGIGLGPDDQMRVFQSVGNGAIALKHGAGQGLSVCRHLVPLMSGQIGVTSALGLGSTFWFTVMLEKQRLPSVPITPKDLAGVRVLVVDDNFTNREVLYHQTKSWNMRTDTASDAEDALRLLREASSTDPYQVAILDQQMADKDGFALAQEIKADPAIADTRLILLSSLGTSPEGARVNQAGFEACLLKPVKQSRLFDCMISAAAKTSSGEAKSSDGLFTSARDAGRAASDMSVSSHDTFHSAAAPATPVQNRSLRILLAEHAGNNEEATLGELTSLGCDTDVVRSGSEVLQAIDFFQYDVVLMDFHMREMDGYETTRNIREQEKKRQASRPPLYIIAMTGNAIEADRDLWRAAGMNDYLAKPLQAEALKRALERALRHIAGTQPSPSAIAAAPEAAASTLHLSAPEENAEREPTIASLEPEVLAVDESTEDIAANVLDLAAETPPVDIKRLNELSDGDAGKLRNLVQRYQREADDMMSRLGMAVLESSAPEIQQWAYKLGETSASCGVTSLLPILRKLEEVCRDGDLATSQDLFSQVSYEMARTERFLSDYAHAASAA